MDAYFCLCTHSRFRHPHGGPCDMPGCDYPFFEPDIDDSPLRDDLARAAIERGEQPNEEN